MGQRLRTPKDQRLRLLSLIAKAVKMTQGEPSVATAARERHLDLKHKAKKIGKEIINKNQIQIAEMALQWQISLANTVIEWNSSKTFTKT